MVWVSVIQDFSKPRQINIWNQSKLLILHVRHSHRSLKLRDKILSCLFNVCKTLKQHSRFSIFYDCSFVMETFCFKGIACHNLIFHLNNKKKYIYYIWKPRYLETSSALASFSFLGKTDAGSKRYTLPWPKWPNMKCQQHTNRFNALVCKYP